MKEIKDRYKLLSFEINERITVANVMNYEANSE